MEHVAQEADVLGAARRRTSPAHLLQGLGELHAVSVRVEDVHEPELPVQLEDDTHVDARLAQPLGFALHVGHLDVGDAARLARVALGKRDLHLAVRSRDQPSSTSTNTSSKPSTSR